MKLEVEGKEMTCNLSKYDASQLWQCHVETWYQFYKVTSQQSHALQKWVTF